VLHRKKDARHIVRLDAKCLSHPYCRNAINALMRDRLGLIECFIKAIRFGKLFKCFFMEPHAEKRRYLAAYLEEASVNLLKLI